jgi:hypothetical protein
LNQTLLWLLYLVSAAVGFLTVHKLGWRMVPSMLAGTMVTIIGWGLLYLLTAEDKRKPVARRKLRDDLRSRRGSRCFRDEASRA